MYGCHAAVKKELALTDLAVHVFRGVFVFSFFLVAPLDINGDEKTDEERETLAMAHQAAHRESHIFTASQPLSAR